MLFVARNRAAMPSMAHEMVQLAVDPQKRFSWPAYVIVARATHGCA
jgi:hypothetical protein